jgi:cold shock CspA family protein
MIGTVKFFEPDKFYGFVVNEGGEWFFDGKFVIGDAPKKGDEVEFWLEDGNSGHELMAVDVHVIEPQTIEQFIQREETMHRETGTIIYFQPRKHYGFIKSEAGKDYFFHARELGGDASAVAVGAAVQFDLKNDYRGDQIAVNVRLVEAGQAAA